MAAARPWAAVLVCIVICDITPAAIYKWTDEQGTVHYEECTPPGCRGEVVALPPAPEPEGTVVRRTYDRLQQLIKLVSDARPGTDANARDRRPPPVSTLPEVECFSAPAQLIGARAEGPTISVRPLTSAEYQQLRDLVHGLEGRWSASMEELLCKGTRAQPQPETRRFRAYVTARWRDDEWLQVEADMDAVDRETRRQEAFWWLVQQQWLRFGDRRAGDRDTPRWDVEILSLSPRSVQFMRKYRRRTGPGTSVRVVEVRALQATSGGWRLDEWFYVQDRLARKQTWTVGDVSGGPRSGDRLEY